MKKGDIVYIPYLDGAVSIDVFDCWGNLNGSKGDGLYIEDPFERVFCSTKDIFQTHEQAQKAIAPKVIKTLKNCSKFFEKELKTLDKQIKKWQIIAND